MRPLLQWTFSVYFSVCLPVESSGHYLLSCSKTNEPFQFTSQYAPTLPVERLNLVLSLPVESSGHYLLSLLLSATQLLSKVPVSI